MIDNSLLDAYVAELAALRAHGRVFAETYPDIAARLDIGERGSRDPQVERVVESSAFLAARLRQMIEQNATELPLATLSMLAPCLIEPVPSMSLMQFVGGTEMQFVPRETKLDSSMSGVLVCFSTALELTVAPFVVNVRRLAPRGDHADGLAVRVIGQTPRTLMMCLGSNQQFAATLVDAFDQSLSLIEIVPPPEDQGPGRLLPANSVRIHGFANEDAALPVRPASHAAHRIVTEFLVFPEKFRFVSIDGGPFASGTEINFWFRRPLGLPLPLPADLISVNRVPVVNLWRAGASPVDVNGRQLEYPIQVDALRYRTVECHSVESVDMYFSDASQGQRLDPVVAYGNIRGTRVRWGARRAVTQRGGEVLLYFQGLDYRTLGRQRMLATPNVLATNRDVAQYLRVGARMTPVEGLGAWQGRLMMAPTKFREALTSSRAMETLIGYLQANMAGLSETGSRNRLGDYLALFPGGADVGWVKGLGSTVHRPITRLRGGQPQPGVSIGVGYDARDNPTTSVAMLRRVLAQLFESQRGMNRVEEVYVDVS